MKYGKHVEHIVAKLTHPLRQGVRRDCIGANPVSFFIRRYVEKARVKQLIGLHLAGLAFFSAIVIPQARDMVGSWEISTVRPNDPVISVIPTEQTYQWPLTQFVITQHFSLFHPALDLATDYGTPIFPITEGKVAWVNSIPWGYGNHVLISHNGEVSSLYAHMSQVLVKPGQEVTRKTEIGKVGATGWATGNHLHVEIYQNGTAINPLEVLPEFMKKP